MKITNWNDGIKEVKELGFDKASPLARLIWSCETGNGIDQHAADDIYALIETINGMAETINDLADKNRFAILRKDVIIDAMEQVVEAADVISEGILVPGFLDNDDYVESVSFRILDAKELSRALCNLRSLSCGRKYHTKEPEKLVLDKQTRAAV